MSCYTVEERDESIRHHHMPKTLKEHDSNEDSVESTAKKVGAAITKKEIEYTLPIERSDNLNILTSCAGITE